MVDASWSSTRKPYPMPTLENDESFTGTRLHHTTQRYGEPAYLGQSQEPWQRLHASSTLASARRHNAGQHHHQVPRDSLDFVLQSLYDHHSGFLQGKNETLVQRETLDSLDGWALKTRVEENPDSGNPSGLPLRRFTVPNKETIHAIAGAIQSHHSAATNRGYSRKQDGGFYCT
ncbi:cilia- and flagella-associated protein 276 isoform X1 [Petromyzon marinus]|uniref:Protein C1orf194 homolog isoform X1 n=1 Tax=Petromyzon marinus TaxID=7757 RepID=A0AAJ7X2N5_PETMA|nr:protein C1orf194 homolog isoform X1 [Petromyzon marinus]